MSNKTFLSKERNYFNDTKVIENGGLCCLN